MLPISLLKRHLLTQDTPRNQSGLLSNCLYGLWAMLLVPSNVIAMPQPQLLTDPFLQLPTQDSVSVVWFTEFLGTRHSVRYGANLEHHAIANTTKLSKVREDRTSEIGKEAVYYREIWRHEAKAKGLPAQRLPYQVSSTHESGQTVTSDRFSLAPRPQPGTPLKILLTSDHQLKPMTSANLQKVTETVGKVDAVFFAGDLVNVPDRASEWFDKDNAFFPSLQGRARSSPSPSDKFYTGGAIIQSAPLFPTIGNHEVMGRFSMERSLGEQFNDPVPRWVAQDRYSLAKTHPQNDKNIEANWIKDHSFNTDTYQEIFSLPVESPGQEQYYATSFGDVRLISLYLTHIWRSPNPQSRGRYQERAEDLNDPSQWGYGQHIFEAIAPGSPQYEWLKAELKRPEFQNAKYKVVMFHHPPHSLGDNVVPAFTDPVQVIQRDSNDKIEAVHYEYPQHADYLTQNVLPLLEDAGTHLVLYGHTHIWNRFKSAEGMHFLETSNVGNSYGAYTLENGKTRIVPKKSLKVYEVTGNPNGLEPIVPSIAPLKNGSIGVSGR